MGSDGGRRGQRAGIVEFLFDELRSAFQDIRQKVFEEGWFGRVVTAAPVVEMDRSPIDPAADSHSIAPNTDIAAPQRRPTFEELWGPRERANHVDIPKDRDGHDFDR